MEIQISNPTPQSPLTPVQWNYEEVKQWLQDGLARYQGVVYTEDMITEAKADRAKLNKVAEAIDTKRKEMKRFYQTPYEDFERQAKELTGMVKAVTDAIGAQVKAHDERRKAEKLEEIKGAYTSMAGNLALLVPYERLHDPKWLNVSVAMGKVLQELGQKIDRITAGLSALDKLGMEPDIDIAVRDVFMRTFDLAAAMTERDRIMKQREEMARYQAARAAQEAEAQAKIQAQAQAVTPEYTPPTAQEPTPTRFSDNNTAEPIHTVTFRIRVTKAQLDALGAFMRANNIRPERV